MGVTVVSGVPGVGLSTVSERARGRLDDEYELLNFGDVMLEQAAAHDLATARSELSGLSRRETRRLQRRAGEFVADRTGTRNVLLTTHLAVRTDAGFLPGLPDPVLRDIAPDQFVLVEAAPETVVDRRAAAERDYDQATPREVGFEQDLNRTAAFDYAVAAGAPVQRVDNDDVDDAAETLASLVAASG